MHTVVQGECICTYNVRKQTWKLHYMPPCSYSVILGIMHAMSPVAIACSGCIHTYNMYIMYVHSVVQGECMCAHVSKTGS